MIRPILSAAATIAACLVLLTLGWQDAHAAADELQSCDAGFESGTTSYTTPLYLAPQGAQGPIGSAPRIVCFDTNGTANSGLVVVGQCSSYTVQLFNMTDGDPNTNVVATLRKCPDLTDQDPDTGGNQETDTTHCPAQATIDDAAAAEVVGHATQSIFIDVGTNTDSDDLRFMIRCDRD